MLRRNIIASIAAILLLFASAYADLNETIYIEIVGQGKFEVIYHRALTNQTGAALGGIIGMSIQSGIEADRDASKRKELEPLIQKDTWKIRFLDTLNNKLESTGTGPESSVYWSAAAVVETAGNELTAVTVIVREPAPTPGAAPTPSPSSTVNDTVRVASLGARLVLVYVTLRRAA